MRAEGASGSDPTGCGCEATCPVVYYMAVDHKEANTARSRMYKHARCTAICAYDSPYSVAAVSCGDVGSESRSAGDNSVQPQGWSVVE